MKRGRLLSVCYFLAVLLWCCSGVGCKDTELNTYEEAERFWERKMYGLAAQSYEQFAVQQHEHPKGSQSLYKAGFIFAYYLLDYPRAIQLFHRLIAIYPNSPETLQAHLNLAEIYTTNLKQFPVAITQYKKIIEIKKQDTRDFSKYYYQIGRCYWLMGDWHQAINFYKKVIRDFPKEEYADRAAYHIGYLHYLEGRYKDAEKAFLFFLKKYPESEWAYDSMYHLASCYEKQDLLKESKYLNEKIRERFPERIYKNKSNKKKLRFMSEKNEKR